MGDLKRASKVESGTSSSPSTGSDPLSDGLSDPLSTGSAPSETARTASQLTKVVGTPGKGERAGETGIDSLVSSATADHISGGE